MTSTDPKPTAPPPDTRRALRRVQRGVTAIEYALIAGLIAIAIVASVESVGSTLSAFYGGLATELSDATRD
jgi:Flp pilus assembly pilin Flp